MKADTITKILILDQGNPVSAQLLTKAKDLFGRGVDGSGPVEYIILKMHRTHNVALDMMEQTIRKEEPSLVLIGATALGEEIAPALGARFQTGVAAHCVDIRVNEEGRLTFVIPAFGGKALGEIFIPGAKAGTPAIATVKPGIFAAAADINSADAFAEAGCRVIDVDAMTEDGAEPLGSRSQGAYRLTDISPREHTGANIADADLVVCGGYGLGSKENWQKLAGLSEKLGGAAACTRAALDADWGCPEDSMIGTSGKAVRPKIYIGFGISGAAHHICGITGADTIISINNDKDAEVFAASDYRGVFDAEKVIDALLEELE